MLGFGGGGAGSALWALPRRLIGAGTALGAGLAARSLRGSGSGGVLVGVGLVGWGCAGRVQGPFD